MTHLLFVEMYMTFWLRIDESYLLYDNNAFLQFLSNRFILFNIISHYISFSRQWHQNKHRAVNIRMASPFDLENPDRPLIANR